MQQDAGSDDGHVAVVPPLSVPESIGKFAAGNPHCIQAADAPNHAVQDSLGGREDCMPSIMHVHV
jgi:hypothetical protein